MRKTYSKIVVVGLLCVFSIACNRAAENESTKISLQLPMNFNKTSFKGDGVAALDNGATAGTFSEWSSIIPAETAEFNCFAAMISGPESYLNRNSCGQKNPATNVVTSMIKFGPFAGVVLGGSSINLEVASGDNRIVTLVGFVAADTSACQNINLPGFDKSKLSKPYILGSSAPLSLKPTAAGGEAVNVPIAMTLNTERWYDSCSGPEFDKSNQLGQATQVVIRKSLFPQNATLQNACAPFEIELKDVANRTAVSSTNTSMKVMQIDGSNSSPVATFETYLACAGTSNSSLDFAIPAGTSSTIRWIKSHSTISFANQSFFIAPIETTIVAEANPPTMNMPNSPASAEKLDFTGPTSVNVQSPAAGNNCFKYEIAYRGFDSLYKSSATGDYIAIKVPDGVTVSSDNLCATPLPGDTLDGQIRSYPKALSTPTSYAVYIQFPGPGIYTLKTERNGGPNHDGALPGTIVVTASSTNNTAINLKIRESTVLPKVQNACYGPFHLSQVNAVGADVPLTTGNASISISTGNFSNYSTFTDSTCTSAFTGGGVNMSNRDSTFVFYIKSLGSTPSEEDITFTIQSRSFLMKLIFN